MITYDVLHPRCILQTRNITQEFLICFRDKFRKTAMATQAVLTPSVSWAQRPKIIFLTINVSDVENPEIKVVTDLYHWNQVW